MINLLHGDCLEQMKTLDDNSVDSIVSDPPYGISFMAKKWDYDVPSVEVWEEAMRVLKPGGHALIACGTRTQHRMVVNIEDAGFEIRDVVSWIYGSGFPKSLNISKAIDKAAGAEREVVGSRKLQGEALKMKGGNFLVHEDREETDSIDITAPETEAAKQWDGWGTALKPACEFFTLCRKPLSEKTIAANVLKWGTGGINIDGCRVEGEKPLRETTEGNEGLFGMGSRKAVGTTTQGRFPANLIHDGSQQVLELFPETAGGGKKPRVLRRNKETTGWSGGSQKTDNAGAITGDNGGSAARFFYCPKASKQDREEGNTHPTVKPTALMAYLCRLITPTGGVVLDPYMGSGSTGKAAVREGFSFVGCELDTDYYEIATERVNNEL